MTYPKESAQPNEISKPVNSGVQAREKVLEAIAPMRRGRPSSPTKGALKLAEDPLNLIDTVERNPWGAVKPAKAHKSGLASISGIESWKAKGPTPVNGASSGMADAWGLPGQQGVKKPTSSSPAAGGSSGFGDSFEATLASSSSQQTGPKPSTTTPGLAKSKPISSLRPADAFDSLNLFSLPKSQAMTLGEAQKVALSAPRPKPSPSPSFSSQPSTKFSLSSPSPASSLAPTPPISQSPGSGFTSFVRKDASPLLKPKVPDQPLSAEQRFPSLEELDATFSPSASSEAVSIPSAAPPPQLPPRPGMRQEKPLSSLSTTSIQGKLHPSVSTVDAALSVGQLRQDGIRSQQVTGTVMREARKRTRKAHSPAVKQTDDDSIIDGPSKLRRQQRSRSRPRRSKSRDSDKDRDKLDLTRRPTLSRRHRSSVSLSPTKQRQDSNIIDFTSPDALKPSEAPRDWLTGDDNFGTEDAAVLRASPEKRTSVLHSPSLAPQSVLPEVARSPSPVSPIKSAWSTNTGTLSLSNAKARQSPVSKRKNSSSDDADGPEDIVGLVPPSKGLDRRKPGHKSRQGSVHDLVDLFDVESSPQKTVTSKHERRSSAFIVPSNPMTAEPSKISASSPSVTRSTVSRKPSLDSRRPSTNHLRQPSAPAKSRASPSPSKSRPQSMLVFPLQKSISDLPASPKSSGLSPPPQLDKTIKQSRRSSISEMVSRYEAIGVSGQGKANGQTAAPAAAPAPASKPTRLRVVSPTTASPTAASMRFPKISPASSPIKTTFRPSLDIPAGSTKSPESPKRTSPVPSSPVRQRASPMPQSQKGPQHSLDLRQVERTERKSPLPSPKDERASSISTEESKHSEPRAPSPERPYQGVGRLIDQWQKKSEETANVPYAVYKGGSRFRRPGIAAGGNKDS